MNETPVANRLHIGIFGKRNTGKSSFLNRITNQDISIVSEVPGTTTDPVNKTMEIRGLGPVVLFDTAGLDDSGPLGEMRMEKTRQVLNRINLAVLVTAYSIFDDREKELINQFKSKKLKFLLVFNKMDLEKKKDELVEYLKKEDITFLDTSCTLNSNIDRAREEIVRIGADIMVEKDTIIGDLIQQGDTIILVVPIDLGAPKGRLILPQVQVIRDIIDNDAVALVIKERELDYVLKQIKIMPRLVICDSQVVLKVTADLPVSIKMTTFSILFSRLRGDLAYFVRNARLIDSLQDNDKVLILEACTHHDLQDDIGRVKIPRWIRQYTGRNIIFNVNAGPFLNKDLSVYKLVITCGGCMINRQEMQNRIKQAQALSVPMTNYGVAISYVQGVLKRALSPFPFELSMLEKD
ncbi:MAG: [FeFe] hydrogenase H-cluster maturation GTPase HydF [bacterium]|nr:[FeFe] hydrogenase H-cluster maturation GTPase HydF [bacterium]